MKNFVQLQIPFGELDNLTLRDVMDLGALGVAIRIEALTYPLSITLFAETEDALAKGCEHFGYEGVKND